MRKLGSLGLVGCFRDEKDHYSLIVIVVGGGGGGMVICVDVL